MASVYAVSLFEKEFLVTFPSGNCRNRRKMRKKCTRVEQRNRLLFVSCFYIINIIPCVGTWSIEIGGSVRWIFVGNFKIHRMHVICMKMYKMYWKLRVLMHIFMHVRWIFFAPFLTNGRTSAIYRLPNSIGSMQILPDRDFCTVTYTIFIIV